jgi:hypothetical protein
MANSENLKPIKKGALSKEEAKRRGQIGGKKRAENYEKRKALKELLEIGLQLIDSETGETNDFAMVMAQIEKAKKGDTQAFTTIRDTIGEKPKDIVENIVAPIIDFGGVKI